MVIVVPALLTAKGPHTLPAAPRVAQTPARGGGRGRERARPLGQCPPLLCVRLRCGATPAGRLFEHTGPFVALPDSWPSLYIPLRLPLESAATGEKRGDSPQRAK